MCPNDADAPDSNLSKKGHNSGTIQGILTKFKLELCIVVSI